MFLGRLVDQRTMESGYVVFYNEMTSGEKICLMNEILESGMSNYELTFPFPALIGQAKEEIQAPEEGWEIDEKLALSLGEGEVYIREFTIRYLKSLGRNDLRLFDCACSTGQFLWTMKQALPESYTIGSDLSAHMVKFATKRVDEIYCANALEPKIPARSVDVVFIRFINSEVVKTEISSIFLKPLTECLKKGGVIIILGHTPILTSAAEMKMLVPNLELLQCLGGAKEWNGIFQFYILRRTD
jgi:isonocardicin synthase